MIRRVLAAAAAIVGGWSLIYAGFWLQASGCFAAFTRECSDAPYEPLRAFFMLDWVWGYQTLVAGVLAVVAASAIFLNGSIERRARIDEQESENNRNLLAHVARVRAKFRSSTLDATTSADISATIVKIERLYEEVVVLAPFAPNIVTKLQFFVGMATIRALSWMDYNAGSHHASARHARAATVAYCELGHMLLLQIDPFLDPDEFVVVADATDRLRLKWKDLDEDEREQLRRYITLADEDESGD